MEARRWPVSTGATAFAPASMSSAVFSTIRAAFASASLAIRPRSETSRALVATGRLLHFDPPVEFPGAARPDSGDVVGGAGDDDPVSFGDVLAVGERDHVGGLGADPAADAGAPADGLRLAASERRDPAWNARREVI